MKKIYVVDMVNGFCKEGALHDTKILSITENIIKELESVPVQQRVFIVDSHEKECVEFDTFPPHCIKGTNEAELIDELKPYCPQQDGGFITIPKNSTSALHVLDFNQELKDVDEVEVVGCCTDICILQFVLPLKTWLNEHNRRVKVIVPEDCVATYDIPGIHDAKVYHEFALKLMRDAGIEVR